MMRKISIAVMGVALMGATVAQAGISPYYNPSNPASPSGYTAGYELFRTIGCPGKQLLDKPCDVPAAAAVVVTPVFTPAPAPVATPAPAAAPAPTPAPSTLSKDHPLVINGVNFNFDSATLRPEAKKVLDQAAADLKAQNYPHVTIDGYTDSIGSAAYNQKLSERRANSVKAYLVEKGIPAYFLKTKGYGETNFVATNKTKEGRAENRRVELHVIE